MAVCVTEHVSVLYMCILCLCISGICAQLCCWVNLQTMAPAIRQMLPSFLGMRESGQENPESASVIVRSTRGQCVQGCSDNSLLQWDECYCSNPEELESFCRSLKGSGFKNNSSLGTGQVTV